METAKHPSSTFLPSEENDVFADFYGIFNNRRDGMPFLKNPHQLTCAKCQIYDFWDQEKLVTKIGGHPGPEQKAFAAEIFIKREGGQRQEITVCA